MRSLLVIAAMAALLTKAAAFSPLAGRVPMGGRGFQGPLAARRTPSFRAVSASRTALRMEAVSGVEMVAANSAMESAVTQDGSQPVPAQEKIADRFDFKKQWYPIAVIEVCVCSVQCAHASRSICITLRLSSLLLPHEV